MTIAYSNVARASSRLIVAGYFLIVSLAGAAEMPPVEQVLGLLGVPQEQVSDLDRGKVVAYTLAERTDKELADGLAVYIPVPLSKAIAFIRKGNFAGISSNITARGAIPDNAGVDVLKRFALSADEAQKLLEVEAGDQFNLSDEEIAGFAALREKLQSADKETVAEAVSQRYREILLQRYQSYRKRGLAGIPAYARSHGEKAEPAAELRTATENGNSILKKFDPELYQAWLNYPKELPVSVVERYSWQNRVIEDRPTATLIHRLIQSSDDGALVLIRQFYAGHSYNSSQTEIGCLPYREGAIIFYTLRSSTDQVAGIGSAMKHSIGRNQIKGEILKQLQRLPAVLAGS